MDRSNALRRTIFICVLLSGLTLAAYWPVLHNDFVHFDDTDYVTENIHVLTGLTWENIAWAFREGYASNWHPLTWLSHMLDVQLFGLHPAGHHLTSMLFHLANTLLLFAVLRRMTSAPWRSAFVAALFAIHPLHVESVAWVAERKDVLSGFFFLLTLWAYVRYVEGRGEKAESRKQKAEIGVTDHASRITDHASRITDHASRITDHGSRITDHAPSEPGSRSDVQRSMFNVRPFSPRAWYGFALGMFALGLMSKPMLVTLPFLLLLLDYWPLGRLKFPWFEVQGSTFNVQGSASSPSLHPSTTPLLRLVFEKLPFLALAGASSAVTFLVQRGGHATSIGLPLGPRLANAVASYLKYLGKTAWPVDLTVFYPHPDLRYPISNQWPLWQIVLAALLLALLSGLALVRLKRAPWFATGWFWYLGTLVPVIGIVQVGGQALADRYTYLPLIGIFIAVVWGAAAAGEAIRGQRTEDGGQRTEDGGQRTEDGGQRTEDRGQKTEDGGQRTESRITDHESRITNHESRITPHASPAPAPAPATLALAGAGLLVLAACAVLTRLQVGYWRNSSTLFEHALAVNPNNPMGHNSVGCDLIQAGKYDLALAHFQAAVEADPTYAEAQCSLGYALNALGHVDQAIAAYQTALRFRPWHAQARASLGALYFKQGKRDQALAELNEALRYNPDSPEAHYDLGIILLSENQFAEAATHLAYAAQAKPGYDAALSALGRALAAQGKLAEAQAQFREVVRLCPTNAEARVNLGNTLTDAGQTNEAAACFATALRLEPGLAGQKIAKGKALLAKGEAPAAYVCFTIAARLQPANAEAHGHLGLLYAQQGKLDDAVREFQQQLRLQPDGPAHYNLGLAHVMQGQLREAAAHYEQAVRLDPNQAVALNDLAWLRATAPQAELRDGAEAVRLAQRACELSGGKEPRFLGTLDAAYAEAGRFDDALATAEKARALAAAAGDQAVAQAAEQRLALYRQGQPYRQTVPGVAR